MLALEKDAGPVEVYFHVYCSRSRLWYEYVTILQVGYLGER